VLGKLEHVASDAVWVLLKLDGRGLHRRKAAEDEDGKAVYFLTDN